MKLNLIRAASAAFLLFAILAGSPAWAVSTTPTAITNSAYTDLGAGPFLIQAPNNSYWYQISDTQPAANSTGFYSTGLDAVQVQSTSHVWARSINAGISLLVAPITSAGSPSGGSAANPSRSAEVGSSTAADGIVPSIAGSAASSQIIKASPGNLYGVYATCTAACWLMVFNATTAPADGATTAGTASGNLQDCVSIPSGTTGSISYGAGPAEVFSVGITAVISSTACATKTAAATGFIHGSAR